MVGLLDCNLLFWVICVCCCFDFVYVICGGLLLCLLLVGGFLIGCGLFAVMIND